MENKMNEEIKTPKNSMLIGKYTSFFNLDRDCWEVNLELSNSTKILLKTFVVSENKTIYTNEFGDRISRFLVRRNVSSVISSPILAFLFDSVLFDSNSRIFFLSNFKQVEVMLDQLKVALKFFIEEDVTMKKKLLANLYVQ